MMADRTRPTIVSSSKSRRTRATRAIVATGSLIAILAIGLPWVDEYLHLRSEAMDFAELKVRLAASQLHQKQLDRIEQTISGELEQGIARTTDPGNTQKVREQLIDFVRQSGGHVRRLEIEVAQTRPWATQGDDPRSGSMPLDQRESRFVLHTHNVELQAEGSLTSVQQILDGIANQGWLMTTESMTVMPTGATESPVKLELQLVLYGLAIADDGPDSEYASTTVTRIRR